MATLFYDHLIDWPKLMTALDEFDIDRHDRLEILEHAEHIIHTEVLMVIVHHLPAEKHDQFLEQFHAKPHSDMHILFLRLHAHGDFETAVRQKSNELIAEIVRELL